jgi:hypothetical protein
MKKITYTWETLPSGLTVPIGRTTEMSDHVRTAFLAIKTKAKEVQAFYKASRVELAPNCDLAKLIENAKAYWEHWFTVHSDKLEMRMLFKTLHLDRIATDILLLKNVEEKEKYLRIFATGSLDFFRREKSKAKDFLWEIEVWARLSRRISSAKLQEPPDIVLDFDDSKIGIACKKLYSEKHFQNVMSQAVSQIADSFEFGIVAINIDDLHPAEALVKAPDRRRMTEFIQNLNGQFIQRNERHLRKYLSTGRLISAIVATNVLVDVAGERPRFNNASQWDIWTIPGLTQEKDKQLRRFYDVITR